MARIGDGANRNLGRESAPTGVSLAAPLSSFIGREDEIEALVALLQQPDVRLVTLTGPGGVGKTRLALQVATRLKQFFADGVATVSLAPVDSHTLVMGSAAQALGVRQLSDRPVAEELADYLLNRDLLLMLDNFEHVTEAAPEIAALLLACPRLKVLVTSRAVLHLSGEHDVAVDPLALLDGNERSALTAAAKSAAVRLFAERARAARSDFALSDETVVPVSEICRRLDGLPLAIELAAARVTHLSLGALLARLEHSLPLLTNGPRDQPARQQTMRQAIVWSYDLLTLDEQTLLGRLSVFAGGFTLDAAEAIAGNRQTDILDSIGSLTDKSLLRIENQRDTEPRYLMLETVRQFGAEQLEAEGKADAARAAHAAYFTALAELVTPGPIGIPNHEQLTALRADYANMRAALDYFYRRGDSGGLLRLAFALCTLWQNFGPWTEGIEWMERAAAIEQPTSVTQIEMLIQLGASAGYQGNFARGERWLTKARDAAVRLGEPNVESYALTVLGAQQVDQSCYAAGEALITEALGKARQAGDPDAEALAFAHLGVATWGLGRVDEAVALLERARASVDQSRLSLPLEVGCRYLGLIAAVSGNLQVAAKQFRESVDYDAFEEHELARWLPNMAVLAVACELPEAAARLFGAAEMLNRITRFVPAWPERGAHEQARAQAREQLGELAFAATVSASQAMTRGDVQNLVEHVLSAAENPGQSGAGEDQGEPSPSPLTPREHEVLRLLVEGRSNAEIGDLLFISHRTAQTHVANILSKLGVTTRAHAAARGVRDGLI